MSVLKKGKLLFKGMMFTLIERIIMIPVTQSKYFDKKVHEVFLSTARAVKAIISSECLPFIKNARLSNIKIVNQSYLFKSLSPFSKKNNADDEKTPNAKLLVLSLKPLNL